MRKHRDSMVEVKPYCLLYGSFFCLTAVILGAFGAHALKNVLEINQLSSFETGVRYQMYHGIVLLIISLKGRHFQLNFEKWIVGLFGLGTLLFSVSIYALNLQELFKLNLFWLGPITPIGGTLLIAAWILIFTNAFQLIVNKNG